MNLLENIKLFDSAVKFTNYSPALPERLHVSKCLAEGTWNKMHVRSLAAPVYVTDLGVRAMPDPLDLYLIHCNLAKVPPVKSELILQYLLTCDRENFRNVLDLSILLWGAYEQALSAVKARKNELLKSSDYTLLTAAGTVAASKSDPIAIELFKSAVRHSSTPEESYLASHRLAATYIKRFSQLDLAEEIFEQYLEEDHSKEISAKSLGLLYNLRALMLLKKKATAAELLEHLNTSITYLDTYLNNPHETKENHSRASRYRSQACINKAQVLIRNNSTNKAVSLLSKNLDFCINGSPEYIGEAETALALAHFVQSDYKDSLKHSINAQYSFSKIGALSGLRVARKVSLASLIKLKKTHTASLLQESFKQDPLGIIFPIALLLEP